MPWEFKISISYFTYMTRYLFNKPNNNTKITKGITKPLWLNFIFTQIGVRIVKKYLSTTQVF